ncbi:MAG: ABC transporter permease [Cellulophaga sp.]
MYTLYFKIALRYLTKNKLYSLINIVGLAIGIASFVLLMLYVNNERSYDKFEGSENIYRVYMDALEGDTFVASDAQTPNLIGPTLQQEFPEIIDYVRLHRLNKISFKYNEKTLQAINGSIADASYFTIFNYPLLKGQKELVLKEPNTIVLTESLAKKIFGDANPLNKLIIAFYLGEEVTLKVSGILKDIPENTHMKTSFLISFPTYNTWIASDEEKKLNWGHCNFFTYLKVGENVDGALLKNKVAASYFEAVGEERYNIEPLEEIHLHSNKPYEAETNGSISRVKFLTAIAFIILILSWLNYVNLSTTKSLERAKEIGIRKVAGAQRAQLIVQSFTESTILNIIAIVIAIILTITLLTFYNTSTNNNLVLEMATVIELLPVLGFVFLGILLASLYPAFLLSSYSPSKALKGKIRTSSQGLNIRKGLIITQFLATIVLLIGSLAVTKQISFLQNQPIGVDLNRIIAFNGEVLVAKSDSLIRQDYKTLEQELSKLPFVEGVCRARTYPGDSYDNLGSFVGVVLPNGKDNSRTIFYANAVHGSYFDLLDIKFISGSKFIDNAQGRSKNIIINEAAMQELEISSPNDAIHKTVNFFGSNWVISGIIENHHHFGLKTAMLPMVILHDNSSANLLVKFNKALITSSGYTAAIAKVESKWKQIFPESTFNYEFLDKKFEAQYKDDKEFNSAFKLFTMLSIFIASLGLFGLTSYTCAQRKKEIGVRKVNGATILQILALLNIDFLKWVGIAFIIAVPISWFAMNNWLSNFAYKTTLNWWIFGIAGLAVLIVALLTASWQSYRAATNNPVNVLRDE